MNDTLTYFKFNPPLRPDALMLNNDAYAQEPLRNAFTTTRWFMTGTKPHKPIEVYVDDTSRGHSNENAYDGTLAGNHFVFSRRVFELIKSGHAWASHKDH